MLSRIKYNPLDKLIGYQEMELEAVFEYPDIRVSNVFPLISIISNENLEWTGIL